MKKSVLFLLFIIIFSLSVSALNFEVTTEKIKDTITLDGVAEFNVTITNYVNASQAYILKTLDYPIWDVYTKPVSNPITVEVPALGSKSILLVADPMHVVSIGPFDVNVRVLKQGTKEQKIVQLRVSIVSNEKLVQGYVPTVMVNVGFPEEIDPRELVLLKIRIDNQNLLDYDSLVVKLNSNTINEEIVELLGPKEKKDLELEIQLDPKILPQEDILTVTVSSDGNQIGKQLSSKFRIISYSEIVSENLPTKSFLKYHNQIKFKNIANSAYTGEVKVETTSFRNLFTLTVPKGVVVTEGDKKYITWDVQLKPDAYFEVEVKENYLVLLAFVVLLIIGILAYYLNRSPLILLKNAANIQINDGGISEFKVVLIIRNRGKVPLKDIELSDKIPNIADVERELTIGTLQPTKILRHEKKGSMIKWVLDDLATSEERIITYRIKSILPILGDFSLPLSTASFNYKGRKKTVKSNSLSIGS
ncbi:MAG: hypothetical protein ABIC04_05465 [Nanoarchaeota archaeon]